ncbi:MAG: aminotransferase class I/II-fold pyridoxal phosphate-dependent enzyme [Hyphomicrobiales bacterium]
MIFNETPRRVHPHEAYDFIDLYKSLGERAETFLPKYIYDSLINFTRLCYEEPVDLAHNEAEIRKYIQQFKENIPGYIAVSLMLPPQEDSKAFRFSSNRNKFSNRLQNIINQELVSSEKGKKLKNILDIQDYSVGTPPTTQYHESFMAKILIGDDVKNLRKFRDVIGVIEDIDEAHWNYFMDTLDQLIHQSLHYTTSGERKDFLHRTEWTVNFKGLNGLIRTVVSGNSDTAVSLIREEVFDKHCVRVFDNIKKADELYELMREDSSSIFVVKVRHVRKGIFAAKKWYPYLTRLIIIDDSEESRRSNTSLVFALHNQIINTLNKVHTKKLGAPASTQLNIRMILENVNQKYLEDFKQRIQEKIKSYQKELDDLRKEKLGETNDKEKNLSLYRLDEFTRAVLVDKYILEKFLDFIKFLEASRDEKNLKKHASALVEEFETRMAQYFYSSNSYLNIATVSEGGGRNQIRSYGEYLLVKDLCRLNDKVYNKCQIIVKILPDNYKRTLKNHFHKNFGINLFLEKYQEYLKKKDNQANNKGRFQNLLIDLGIEEEYNQLTDEERATVRDFLSNLGNLDKTSISDDVQMIVRDLLCAHNGRPKPYIIYNQNLAWEYTDLFPDHRFDINPFNLETPLKPDGRTDYDSFVRKLSRIKSSLQIFDDTGNLWDSFCDNTTIIINDPGNPTGYSDFNTESLIRFLQFITKTKITIFLDEAYNDAIKLDDSELPKWRTISKYLFNNMNSYLQISAVSSVSTTKNLGATGDRLGAVVATPAKKDFVQFIKKAGKSAGGNSCSLYLINNTLKVAQHAKKIKDKIDQELPVDASRQKIRSLITSFIHEETERCARDNSVAGFEGSPVYLFLLDELVHLDQLDVLHLPDDFKYRGKPFYSYYQKRLAVGLNRFRINRLFRGESNRRLRAAIKVAEKVVRDLNADNFHVVHSDGSYLFNMIVNPMSSATDLETFCQYIAAERGIACLPYQTGMIRFSLGGYLQGDDNSYKVFRKDFENSLRIFIKYWNLFQEKRNNKENLEIESADILREMFAFDDPRRFAKDLIRDYNVSSGLQKQLSPSLKINHVRALYHASPDVSGVSINTVQGSSNSVFEFQGTIGQCHDVKEFINSRAFTKIYEHLLSNVYKKIPQLRNLHFNVIASRYSKATLLKYIDNKKNFQPNHYVLDSPEDYQTMREILIEMERLLFSPGKMKILALDASGDFQNDKIKLEGVNRILKKFIQEIMLHFDLPFDQAVKEPSRREIIHTTVTRFEEITGVHIDHLNLRNYVYRYVYKIRSVKGYEDSEFVSHNISKLIDVITERILDADLDFADKVLYLYLMRNDDSFAVTVIDKLGFFEREVRNAHSEDVQIHVEKSLSNIITGELSSILDHILRKKDIKVNEADIHQVTQRVVVFLIAILNRSKGTTYYNKYIHTLIKVVESEFMRQNSNINEMIQHGITLYKNFGDGKTLLETWEDGQLKWISDIMNKCGVISVEQPVQIHTRIATDAKKREHPFHKVDSTRLVPLKADRPEDYLKVLDIKPQSSFFANRLKTFAENLDANDYRCKIISNGMINEMMIFQKSYIKYLTDNHRLMDYFDTSLDQIKDFVPDTLMFYGAPEKLISFPKIGYFNIPGPKGNIKTIVTPLRNDIDYFGDIKKPRLQMMNERIKEMGGIPKHGSLFAVEMEDGCIFVIEIDGDSGVGKSEMIAALVLKWLKHNLPGIRSVKLIAGDMFQVFRDKEGHLYGFGTEVGDFSRVTDFDPDYIRYYRYLFETSADSNVEDLNSRSTVSGLCDISMPFKIDVMLTASNYSAKEAGITRVDNPENFLLYIDSHGERKEKATSQDGPNFQRTLLRYDSDRNIVEVLAKHGNYLDDILDWVKDADGIYYLASSYKMMEKIDIEDVVNSIFNGKNFDRKGVKGVINKVTFDIIRNRFIVYAENTEGEPISDFVLDRSFFSSIFDSIASTPGGQPFIAEDYQIESRMLLIDALKGGTDGKGKGKQIKCAVLSTEIGKKGREIAGPRKAAESLKGLLQEARIANPEIIDWKNHVKKIIIEKYPKIFSNDMTSNEVWRYNFYLYQLHLMRQAEFVRMDKPEEEIRFDNFTAYQPVPKGTPFGPLLITPNLNIELNSFSETYLELMSLPNYPEFAEEFFEDTPSLYVAEGYSEETVINNMIIQLLLLNEYISIEDLPVGRVAEMVNRETIAAAKYAVVKFLQSQKEDKKPTVVSKPETPVKKNKKK